MWKVLFVDGKGEAIKGLEERLGPEVAIERACSFEEGLRAFEGHRPDAVVLGLGLSDGGALKVLESIKAKDRDAHVIIADDAGDMENTVEAIKRGAFDYIARPVSVDELELSLKKVFQNIELHRRLKDLLTDAWRDYRVDRIVGKSRCMEEIFKTIAIASQSKVTILIQGESGTGKELIARAIHYNSPERDRPFIGINCSALVETLLESELFGHEKGAFTGALFRKEGKFEVANGGTVFLDEIGEMSPALQVKLLRVLQEKSFERVGGSETIKTDVRVIAATNKDLQALNSKGLFREDLYYRLKVITIEAPPLRERKEDIPLLVGHLLEKANRELHKKVRKVPEEVMGRLMSYPWPGNVRELENVITRGVLLAKDDVLLDVYPAGNTEKAPFMPENGWWPCSLEELEKEHIRKTLGHTGWNKSRAAALLGMTLPRLSRKIEKYGLKPGFSG